MTATQRRLRAVFLCAYAAAASVIIIAAALLYLALPAKVQAQAVMVCNIAHGTVDEVMDLAGEYALEFHQLSPIQADQYITAILPARPAGSEGLRAIVTVGERGAVVQMVQGGIICVPILRVNPQSHERGMSAAMGQSA